MRRSDKWWAEPVAKVREWSAWIWNMRVGKVPVGPIGLALLLLILILLIRLGSVDSGADAAYDAAALDSVPVADSTADSTAAPDSLDLGMPGMQRQFEEADLRFTYKGEPIHPFGVRELMEPVTDEYPGPVIVDLAGINGGYRYPATPSRNADGGVTAKNPPRDECLDPGEGEVEEGDNLDGYFTYRRLGKLRNGWHVLRIGDNGGGPSVFEALLLVRFRLDREYGESVRQRLLMERRGMIRLGDRYEGRIRILGDSITLTADVASGSRQEDATFTFPATD
jgi:hypothetical protein